MSPKPWLNASHFPSPVALELPAAMNQSFLQSPCDEEGFHGTWHDFLTVPENEHGAFVELKEKKNKKKKKSLGQKSRLMSTVD